MIENLSSLRALAASIAARRIAPSEVARELNRRHAAHGRQLNAYVAWADASANEPVSGPSQLAGIPISIKDCIGVKGLPTFAGTGCRLPARWEEEGPVVVALRRQSAMLVGKTVQTEFALSALGLTPGLPQPRNPWDAKRPRSAGGSSTGAALSLLEGTALLALGTDTLGSVRIPASACGVVGFRGTVGRWPAAGVVPLSPTFDTIGLLANDVADVQYAFRAIEGSLFGVRMAGGLESKEPTGPFRIGLPDAVWADCEGSIARAGRNALNEVAGHASLVDVSVVDVSLPEAAEAFSFVKDGSIAVAEFDAFLAAALPEFRAQLSPPTAALAERGKQTSARRYLNDLSSRRDLASRALRCFEHADVLAFPTIPVTPPTLDRLDHPDTRRDFHLNMLRNTCISSVLGLCAVSIPVGLDAAGIPVGLELAAAPGREDFLLSVAGFVERQIGTRRERLGEPPLFARLPVLEAGGVRD